VCDGKLQEVCGVPVRAPPEIGPSEKGIAAVGLRSRRGKHSRPERRKLAAGRFAMRRGVSSTG